MTRRLLLVGVIAAGLLALAGVPADAYQLFADATNGSPPERWPALSLPIALRLDNGPTDVSAEIATALGTWNAVPTALDPWGTATKAVDTGGTPVDFTGANFGTAWGSLTGDGQQEVVFDEDGSALTALGLAPAAVNGIGQRHTVLSQGQAVIDDMYLVVNGSRADFDRQATEIHELGHTLGLAHSSVGFGLFKDGSLSEVLQSQVPTMDPYSAPGTDRQTLEPDDQAALAELYPTASFATTTGTITGTVTRCGSGEPVLGANVRAINVATPAIQLSRVTGFDGRTDGSYTINGVPPGTYEVVVEPLAGDQAFLERLAMYTRVDSDFIAEHVNPSKEGDCAQDTDPNAHESIPVGATGTEVADVKVDSASLALVVDVTGSMGPEIGAIKTALNAMVTGLEAASATMPNTSIVTFDDHASVAVTSRDPGRLRDVINGLTTHSTADCPEGSNAALMTAGRLLGNGGNAVLVTDAESRPDGPSRTAVNDLFASKNARLSVLLSGGCPPGLGGPPAKAVAPATSSTTVPLTTAEGGNTPDEPRPLDVLGLEGDVRTFSEESLFSGGVFSFQPQIKGGTPDATTRYADTLANLGTSAVLPAVATVNPAAVPQATALTVELTGAHTSFGAASTVTVAGSGVAVTSTDVRSPTRIVLTLAVAADAPTGFRDVTVSTDLGGDTVQVARGLGALQVTGPPSEPTILSVTPSTVAAGATADVTISGGLTHFAGGTSVANLGAGVTVNHLTVNSSTTAVANVTVAGGTTVGFRDVTVQTGGETAGESVPGPLLVVAPPPPVPRLTGASPGSGVRGTTVDIAVTGADTGFGDGTSAAAVSGAGAEVLSTTVSGPTSLVARVRIAADAPLGFRDLKVTTGAEHAALPDGFAVTAPPAAPPPPGPPPGAGGEDNGGGGGDSSACTDHVAPVASLLKGRAGLRPAHRRLRLRGRARDTGCVATISVRGRVARVEVAIALARPHHRCRFVMASGRLTRKRRCARPVRLRAKGTASWSLTTRRRLPRGRYTVEVRAVDAAGNRQARAARRGARVR